MAKLIALDSFSYRNKVYENGDIFEVESQIHIKQFLSRGLAELYRKEVPGILKKNNIALLQAGPASVQTMSSVLGDGVSVLDKPKAKSRSKKTAKTTKATKTKKSK